MGFSSVGASGLLMWTTVLWVRDLMRTRIMVKMMTADENENPPMIVQPCISVFDLRCSSREMLLLGILDCMNIELVFDGIFRHHQSR